MFITITQSSTRNVHSSHLLIVLFSLLLFSTTSSSSTAFNSDQLELLFTVSEGVPVGTFIGVIKSHNQSLVVEPPFLIVPISDAGGASITANVGRNQEDTAPALGTVDTDLNIDQSTGEIRTAIELDREKRTHYSFIAISLTGVNVYVKIVIEDVNDNSPQFPTKVIELEFPENSKPRDVKRTLPPAVDLDRGLFGTQAYRIVTGNVGNAFRLVSHREKDDILYLDLQVNGALDRETIASFTLVIEALDGGQPPLTDQLTVKIVILDHNDCEPIFTQSQYYGTVTENVTLGTSVIKVTATDSDEGENGHISYQLKQSSTVASSFAINKSTGWIYVTKPLDFEQQELHELVVIASDNGSEPLETSAFVSVRVTDVHDNQPTVSILFLTANSKPEISEDAKIGDLIARVSVADAKVFRQNRKRHSSTLSVALEGASEEEFVLRTTDQIVYLLVVNSELDREKRSKYTLSLVVSDRATPASPNTTTTFELEILDVNDNAPYFERPVFHATLPEAADIGSSVFQMNAIDLDSDSLLTYAFVIAKSEYTDDNDDDDQLYFGSQSNETHRLATRTSWFSIDRKSGLIVTRTQVDCETDSEPHLTVIATDSISASDRAFTATATLIISISDINDNEPIFDQSFYNVTVREDTSVGTCILAISATDPDCGVNALVNYSFAEQHRFEGGWRRSSQSPPPPPTTPLFNLQHDFTLDPRTGQLCIAKVLDFERTPVYDIPVLATDRGGLSTTAMLKVQVLDTNDNSPVFYPREYKVSVTENVPQTDEGRTPLVIVAATDQDSPHSPYGQIVYRIESGNEKGYFEIDSTSGEIFLLKALSAVPGSSSFTNYHLTISARDGAGLESKESALVLISVLPSDSDSTICTPIFLQRQFTFEVIENVAQGAIVGTVLARLDTDDDQQQQQQPIFYAIYSGDPDGYFTIDPRQGSISVKSAEIDREKHSYLLLNVQAYSGQYPGPYRYAHTQVNITILDENDNTPLFPSAQLKISIPENVPVDNTTVFVAYAVDYDAGVFGEIRYSIHSASEQHRPLPFMVDETTGQVRLRRHLDYESVTEYQVRIVATDGGQLSSQMIVNIFVQDANDNAPMFVGSSQTTEIVISGLRQIVPLYRIQVSENVPVNSHLYQMKATDLDTGNNARLTYSAQPKVAKMDSMIPIDIFPNNGILYVKDALDRESVDQYELLIHVIDHGLPHTLNATAVLQISVLDINDNRPYWQQSTYSFEVSEDTSTNTVLGNVSAFDVDLGANATMTYLITEGSDSAPFQIDPSSGQIYLRSLLDRELKSRYEFTVEVHDHGVPQQLFSEEKALVTVAVLDINDNRPVFEHSELNPDKITVPLGTSGKSTVATFKAVDADSGENGTVTYMLTDGDEFFTIDSITGALKAKVDIKDSLKRTTHSVAIVAQDGGGKRSLEKIVQVEIVDKRILNINLDKLEVYSFELGEKQFDYGTRIGTIQMPGKLVSQHQCANRWFSNFQFQLKHRLPFFVDGSDSQLTLLVLEKPEKISNYELLLCVDWEQCLVSILNGNDLNLNSQQHQHQPVQCDHYVKVNVGVKLASGGECRPFSIENRDLYEVKIPWSEAARSSHRANELLSLNQSNCGQPVAYHISSPLMSDDTLRRLFVITEQTLNFRSHDTSLIQRHLHHDFVLSLAAKQESSIIQSVPVRVKILSSDNRIGNIVFSNEKFLELEEDCCRVGSAIIQARINISHDDFRVKYFLATYGEQHLVSNDEQFTLNPDTGLLYLRKEFDFERKHEHRINITAVVYDSKSPIVSVSHILKIRIVNTNDEIPVFGRQSYEKEVSENARVGQVLLQVEAKDSDQPVQANITYVLPGSYQYADYFEFNHRNGELKLARTLDRETIDEYRIPIYAFDEDFKHYAFTLVHLTVLDVNDNQPYFISAQFELKIPESVAPGTVIYNLIAIDPDLNSSQPINAGLQYRILSGNVGHKFVLHSQRGELSTNALLDREMQSVYHLLVEVSDSFYVSTCNVTVELIDINDNAPIFDKSDYYAILDDASYGWLPVVTVRAIDSDGDKLLYSIDTSSNLTRYFNLNAETGEISIHASLLVPIFRHLNSNVFTFDVSAIEAGKSTYRSHSSKAKVHITLVPSTGANSGKDQVKLAKYPYVIIVDEPQHSVHVGQKIGTLEMASVQTSDSKSFKQSTNQYSYRVMNGGESHRSFTDYFTIQPQSGNVLVKRPLNTNYYEAMVEVVQNFDPTGHNNHRLSTITLVQIFIGGVDDRKFLQTISLNDVKVSEGDPIGTEIINLGSYIRRALGSSKYNFVLAYSDVSLGHFDLNSQNGIVRLRKSLDYESQPSQIELIVFAYRSSARSLYEQAYMYSVNLELTNVDDNLPQFTQRHYIASIREGELTGSAVAQVNAIDIDDVFNQTNQYSYYIVDGNADNAFSISSSGLIRTNIVLDREIHDRYYLKIIVTEMKHDMIGDGLWPSAFLADESNYQHYTQCTVEVIVIDQNDNVPVFPPYKEISVSEDAQVGSVIATWTANDVDIYPILSYTKQRPSTNSDRWNDLFEIGLYTGKIILKSSLKPLMNQISSNANLVHKVRLSISASDQLHSVDTEITINIKRNQSNLSPVFLGGGKNFIQKLNLDQEYSTLLYETNVELFRMSIESSFGGEKIIFRLNPEAGSDGFYIDQFRAIIYNNRTMRFRTTRMFSVTIFARFQSSQIESQASLLFIMERNSASTTGNGYYYYSAKKETTGSASVNVNNLNSYSLEIESTQIGIPLLRLPKQPFDQYVIVAGNTNKNFLILRGNELVLVSRPLIDQYSLKIKRIPNRKSSNSTITVVHVKVHASNVQDSATFSSPFKSSIFEIEISESEKIGSEIQSLKSLSTKEGKVEFKIFSGNELNSFSVDPVTGLLVVKQKLDYETNAAYRLGVWAQTDHGSHFAIVNIQLINANEYCPQFPSQHFRCLVEENSLIGTKVIPIRAIDQDGDQLNYTVVMLEEWNQGLFQFDPTTGYLVTTGQLDYEQKTSHTPYKFVVKATDTSGSSLYASSDVQCGPVETVVEVQLGSVDEYSPQFGNESYHFLVTAAITKSRVKIGQVSAVDSDAGPDGSISYSIKSISPSSLADLVSINSSGGWLSMSTYANNLPRQFSLIVSASSGRMNSMNSLAMVTVRLLLVDDGNELDLGEVINTIDQGLSTSSEKEASLPGWIIFITVLLLLLTVVLAVSIVVIRMHQKEQQHFMSGHLRSLANHSSLFRKIGPFNDVSTDPNISPAYSVAHYGTTVVAPAPPCYNDVTLTSANGLISHQEGHSASSGRGSAEDDADLDDVDEEIRMINESSNYYTEGQDSCEEITTTAEYLARLGVSNHYEEEQENTSSITVDEEDDESVDVLSDMGKMGQSRYGMKKFRSRVPSVSTSTIGASRSASGEQWPSLNSIVHNEEELSGSYNWDYLQHCCPKYQPLSSVFAEIARLKSATNVSDISVESESVQPPQQHPEVNLENMSQHSTSTTSTSRARALRAQSQQMANIQIHQVPPPPPQPVPFNYSANYVQYYQQPSTQSNYSMYGLANPVLQASSSSSSAYNHVS